MKRAFKISTNIERDSSIQIDYIVTKNTNDVFDKIDFNHSKGQNSFTIIGSYGTGKSSFLWAFEKHLKGESYFNKLSKAKVLPVVDTLDEIVKRGYRDYSKVFEFIKEIL